MSPDFIFLFNTLAGKQLGLLREIAPNAALIGVLVNPTNPALAETLLNDVQTAAQALKLQLHANTSAQSHSPLRRFSVSTSLWQTAAHFDIGTDGFFTDRIELLAELTVRHGLPAISSYREFPAAGGLISYGTSIIDAYRQIGAYTGRIIKGEKPSDLPVMQPTKFEFLINLKTARALGLAIPPSLLSIADEVIE